MNKPISLIDIYPTMCSMAGIPVPTGLDGMDYSEALRTADETKCRREYAFSSYYRYGIRLSGMELSDETPEMAWRCVNDERWKYVEIEKGSELLFDLEKDPLETENLASRPECDDVKRRMRNWLHRDFSWESAHDQLREDRERLPQFYSGYFPGTPNQYMLPDGRVFDAEKSLYDARWLHIPPGFTGGIIPQQFG